MCLALDGRQLEHASERLKHDDELVDIAVTYNGWAIETLDHKYKNDRTLVMKSLKSKPSSFSFLSEELKNDKNVVERACLTSDQSFEYAASPLRRDKEFIVYLFNKNIDVSDYISDDLKEEIGGVSSIEYLKNTLLKEKLDCSLAEKPKSLKLKI